MTDKKYPISSFIAGLHGDYFHAGFTSKDIVASEAKGQQDLINSTQLPIEGNWEILESWGVMRAGERERDDLFCEATLPDGWIKRSTDHSMWSELIDQLGRKRASIFYKAAYYDRSATISPIENRFTTTQQSYPSTGKLSFDAIDLARDTTIYTGAVGHFAFKTADPSIVGFVLEDVFYTRAVRKSYGKEFFQKCESAEGLTSLVKDEIYKKYHHVKPIHELLDAANNQARAGAENFIANFLGDREQWEIE